jgi:hypothetical protein
MATGDWTLRELCPDGTCVGVIGPDGTCKLCGRAAQNWGDERKRGLIEPAQAAPDDDDDDDAAHGTVDASTQPPGWSARALCPDGSCIGVIGPDGTCKVCGKLASGTPDDAKRVGDESDEDAVDDEDVSDKDEDEDDEDEDEDDEDEDEDEEDEEDDSDESDGEQRDAEQRDEDDESSADADDDALVAAAKDLAGVASAAEVASAKRVASSGLADDRELCPDGACIGVIGANGRCKICGKQA